LLEKKAVKPMTVSAQTQRKSTHRIHVISTAIERELPEHVSREILALLRDAHMAVIVIIFACHPIDIFHELPMTLMPFRSKCRPPTNQPLDRVSEINCPPYEHDVGNFPNLQDGASPGL
jgi:hypothetical protein